MNPDGTPERPVQVRGDLDDNLSRWLWLVKWVLAIPHYIVLLLLWVAFVVLTVVAGFAVLFTGRYPRTLFDFNVGVIRWSWRVQFYSFVLGTDRYPPFSVAPDPDYPADLHIRYPEQLSRGLVLVKWWLLAIPHYLILSALGNGIDLSYGDDRNSNSTISLLVVLVLIAAISLLFTARYPRGLFDFLVGIYRWIYRVMAYAALMRDDYPPFRLDQGAREPAAAMSS